ncbi:MAG: NERD domain-containing protein [Methanospirillum sp.]|nr:NERD domain-containing protein [Methanospirillum sp.]
MRASIRRRARPSFLSDFRLDNSQVDCLLVTRNALIVIDFKAYRGVIRGDENRPWW